MKKLLVLFIILTIFLSGCGIYHLSNFALPDDTEFLALIQELDTPEKIGNYMIKNFTYQIHDFYTPDPYTLYLIKKGDCNDFATFGIFIANNHGYETYQIKISYINTFTSHIIVVYKENEYYTFSENQYYYPVNYNNFFDIVELNSYWTYLSSKYIWSKYVVYDYNMNIIEQVIK